MGLVFTRFLPITETLVKTTGPAVVDVSQAVYLRAPLHANQLLEVSIHISSDGPATIAKVYPHKVDVSSRRIRLTDKTY